MIALTQELCLEKTVSNHAPALFAALRFNVGPLNVALINDPGSQSILQLFWYTQEDGEPSLRQTTAN